MGRIYLSPPDVGELEREYIWRAFDGGWIAPVGPDLDAFERDVVALTGWPGAVAVSSGTAALHLALLVSGVKAGDDVAVSSFTFAASANVIKYCGASPVFIDSEATSWNMSPQMLSDYLATARRANRLPAAVVVVDLYGQCADYDELVPQCDELGIPLIEDAAEAIGATHRDRAAGTLGTSGVFSFNGNKIMTTSGGGMFLSPDAAVADRARHLATQAREPAVHYEHTEVGFNYRLSNLLAALGRAQLERLPAMLARRLEIHARYRACLSELPGVEFQPLADWGRWNGWLTCVEFSDPAQRDAVQRQLDECDVESRPLWKPMHLQPSFANEHAVLNGVSSSLFDHGLCLPSGSGLSDEQVDFVAAKVAQAVHAAAP